MSYYRDQLERWLKTINVNSERVLDIGGAAYPIQKRVNSFTCEEYLCFDTGSEEAKTEFVYFDLNLPLTQLKGFDLTKDTFKFDCIFCLEVFEYIWNPVQAMENIRELLALGGLAYISFPAIYPVHNPVDIDHLRYTKRAIEKYCNINQLKIIELKPRVASKGINALSQFYSLEGMHPLRHSLLPFDIGYLLKVTKES